jgi:hypothetical protein
LKQRIFCVLDKNDTFSSASGKPQKGHNIMSIMYSIKVFLYGNDSHGVF